MHVHAYTFIRSFLRPARCAAVLGELTSFNHRDVGKICRRAARGAQKRDAQAGTRQVLGRRRRRCRRGAAGGAEQHCEDGLGVHQALRQCRRVNAAPSILHKTDFHAPAPVGGFPWRCPILPAPDPRVSLFLRAPSASSASASGHAEDADAYAAAARGRSRVYVAWKHMLQTPFLQLHMHTPLTRKHILQTSFLQLHTRTPLTIRHHQLYQHLLKKSAH